MAATMIMKTLMMIQTDVDSEDSCPRGYVGLAGNGMDRDEDGCLDSTEDDDDDNDGVLDVNDECEYAQGSRCRL